MEENKNVIKVEPHTIFMCIGPTNSGKSTFINNILEHNKEKLSGLNVQVLGSDQIRRELIGQDLFRYNRKMLEASNATFRVFEAKLEALTSYPINAEIVFLDCTSLHPDFRQYIKDIAKKREYNLQVIVFNYKDTKDHLKYAEEGYENLVYKNLRKFRTQVLPKIKARNFQGFTRIKSKDFGDWELELSENFEVLRSCQLDTFYDYSVIGDIHGCLDEFRSLLVELGSVIENGKLTPPENRKFILIGDLVDKGPQIKETVDFITDNIEHFIIVQGNHEYGNYQYITGKMKPGTWTDSFIDEWFDTIRLMEKDEDLKNKLISLVEKTKPFVAHPEFVCTHVPCKSKYIGKISKRGRNGQIRWSYPHREEKSLEEYAEVLSETLEYLKEETDGNFPFHVFGHVATANLIRYRKKLGIDLGCYKGGKLMAVTFYKDSDRPQFTSVESTRPLDPEGLVDITPERKPADIKLEDLEPKDMVRLRKICKNRVNFLSGTVCPADKDTENNTLESLEKGLEYFKSLGVKKVHLQTKYMGSRGTVHLTPDNETSRTISRRGYNVKFVNFDSEYQRLRGLMKEYFDKGAEVIILDTEIMPWSALGSGLIDKEFRVVGDCLDSELKSLSKSAFFEHLWWLTANKPEEFDGDNSVLSKKEMVEKYSHPTFSSYRSTNQLGEISEETERELIDQYNAQLELYGSKDPDDAVTIEPFSLLKVVYADTEETFFDSRNADLFDKVNPEGRSLEIDFDDPGYLEKATKFYDELTETMEGIVIKPEIVDTPNVAPYMKVRNPRYLSIIYGYDYQSPRKYSKLLNQKNIYKKLSSSIKEFKIGRTLLEIPYKEINKDNIKYISLVAHFLKLEAKSAELDPRL